ncbi:hypothetical protein F4561_001814 [Lipingzhangella halophila]|uniref:DUF6194 domain-containing protein n=1 Tax=Lipingzhangella halophila TaxID=1783352 RepID=A0A7W7RFD2_9ACTN|nr:DUF6194 family protein [Lipingzhangella halophila]MBB4930994.1 hypothetical protein [Lipingzhangella halophila]
MDATAMTHYITETFDGVRVVESSGDTFLFYDPEGDLPSERLFSFAIATVVTSDSNDTVSDLDHPGAYRVNIGLPKGAYTARFGPAPAVRDEHGVLETGYDYAVRDRVLPHPHYASQHWVCVVSPGPETTGEVRRMLDEAHRFVARKHANNRARRAAS